jgi:iron complex transport system permease protein
MTAPVTSGSHHRPVVRVGDALSIPYSRRGVVVFAVLVLVIAAVAVITLTAGRLGIELPNLLPALLSDPGGKEGFVLGRLRGPRLAVAVATGATLGVAGTLFQTVTRNPLGSPDVIGLGAGAAAGAAAAGLLWPGVIPIPAGALLGASIAMAAVWLGTGRGFSSPSRFIIVGIGVSAMGYAFTQYVIARSGREQATVLASYLNGTLASRSWGDAAVIWAALAVLLPAALLLGRRLLLIEMGDETADALGGRSGRTRLLSIAVAVCLSAAAVSVAGPVAFVALTAPQIARRLGRMAGAGIVLSAATGALLLATADLLVQQAPFDVHLPVGILTAAVGGVYLGYLLIREWKKGTI